MKKPIGQLCLNCGSSWSDERLAHEKRFKPNLISCCPDREMVDVYTHPVKELTDEEIYKTIFESGFDKELFMQNINSGIEPISLTLAKAILRKAQEK